MNQERKLEEEILASFEREEWRSAHNLNEEIARHPSIASVSLVKLCKTRSVLGLMEMGISSCGSGRAAQTPATKSRTGSRTER
jgi:hypothetical protein